MTGYGCGTAAIDGRELIIEIKAVNHRYLDINLRLPRVFLFLEDVIKKKIGKDILRGHLEIYSNYRNDRQDARKIQLDEGMLTAYVSAAKQIAQQSQLGMDVKVSHLMNMPDVLKIEQNQEDQMVLEQLALEAVSQAIQSLNLMRRKEYVKLKKDIDSRLTLICQHNERIHERSAVVIEEYRKKLEVRIQDLAQGIAIDEQRLSSEVVFYADRSSIHEELVRLGSHIEQLKKTLSSKQAMGKKMDFIVQEMNREINTIGSKSCDIEIASLVVEVKSEIEKIREQIQNIQ